MLSVIIPVYNTERYLRRCLESIVSQTYNELEIILIDDGSTDSSGIICDEYAGKYDNIYVQHQEKQGVVVARNKGIAMAKSEYVTFVDSDDWLDSDFYEKMLLYLDDEDADMITSGMIYEWENKTKIVIDTIAEGIYQREEIKTYIWDKMTYDIRQNKQGITSALWNKLFKREKLKKVMDQIDTNVKYCEDGAIVYTFITRINKLIVTHYCGYHYVQHEDSSIHTFSETSFDNILALHRCMRREILRGQENKTLEAQIDFYVEPLLRVAIRSVYGISMNTLFYLFPFHRVPRHSKIILYGAGEVGKAYYKCVKNELYAIIVSWVDRNYKKYGDEIEAPCVVEKKDFDYVVIAVTEENAVSEIKQSLKNMGVCETKIIWEEPQCINYL